MARNGVMMRLVAAAAVVVPFVPSGARAAQSLPAGLGVPVISISKSVSLKPAEADRIVAAARTAGALGFPAGYATFPMTAYSRGDRFLMTQPKGWRVPMGTRILPVEHVRLTGGDAMAALLEAGQVIMGENSAKIRDAEVGDVITLRDSRNAVRRFTIGMIVDNDFAQGEDLIMSADDGHSMGMRKISRVNIVGFSSPKRVLDALRAKGFRLGTTYRVRTSWDLPNPDATLGIATTKMLLGEFAFRPTDSAAIVVSAAWGNERIVWKRTYGTIPLRNNCHEKVVDAVEGALAEIVAKGLRSSVDVPVSNRYGGCFVGRYNRLAGLFGAPSRHAFGMAIDINTTTNPQWGRPQMNCDVVRIFRKWGFAWGGNFWPADGMHFEWVGERRDLLGYPSRYCPNKVAVPATTAPVTPSTSTSTTSTSTTTTSTTVSVTTTVTPASSSSTTTTVTSTTTTEPST